MGVRAEELGFDSVWVPDSPLVHGLPYPRTPELYAAGWERVRATAESAGRLEPDAALYLTVALDRDADAARRRPAARARGAR